MFDSGVNKTGGAILLIGPIPPDDLCLSLDHRDSRVYLKLRSHLGFFESNYAILMSVGIACRKGQKQGDGFMSNDANTISGETTLQDTVKTVYRDIVNGGVEAGEQLVQLLNENRDHYFVLRDSDGRILIKVSLLGGLMLVVISLVISRMRWMPLLAVVLSLTHVELSIETDPETNRHSTAADM